MKPVLTLLTTCALLLPGGVAAQQDASADYDAISRVPLRSSAASMPIQFKILVDSANLGGDETRIAELTFPAGYSGQAHLHDAIEIFYVLSGRFGHEVNGVPAFLEPGQVGIVRPGDTVAHSVRGSEPAVVLTIWLPGGAAAPFHVAD